MDGVDYVDLVDVVDLVECGLFDVVKGGRCGGVGSTEENCCLVTRTREAGDA